MERNSFMSKKVFFLYPHSVIQQDLVRELVAYEYAVYLVSDHKKFRSVVKEFDEPIVFINIDEGLEADGWIEYVREMMDSDDNNASIGVLSYNEEKALLKRYLMELMVPCGFVKLKLGLEESRKIILKTLIATEAKGRRKYLRIDCWGLQNTDLNVKVGDKFLSGKIKDISSVGMAFVFDEAQSIPLHTVLPDIQCRLRGKLAKVSGPVMGSRVTADGVVYVMLFDKYTSSDTKDKIHNFIYEALQSELKEIFSR